MDRSFQRQEEKAGQELGKEVRRLLGQHHAAASPREHVLGQQLDSLRQQTVGIDESAHGPKQSLAQPGFVRAAGRGWDQVDIRLARDCTVFGPNDDPRRALALSVRVVVGAGIAARLERRQQRLFTKRAPDFSTVSVTMVPGSSTALLRSSRSSSSRGTWAESKYFGFGHARTRVPLAGACDFAATDFRR